MSERQLIELVYSFQMGARNLVMGASVICMGVLIIGTGVHGLIQGRVEFHLDSYGRVKFHPFRTDA